MSDADPRPDAGTPPPDVTIDAPPAPATTSLDSSQAGEVRVRRMDATQSAVGRAVTSELHSSQGAIGLVRARSVVSEEGAIGAVAAEQVETRGGFAFLVVARRVSGDVTVLLDWRGAVAALAGLLVIGRLLRGRR